MTTLAVIIDAGFGSRLYPFSINRPKSLISFCGQPLLNFTLEALARHGIADIVLAYPAGSDVKRYVAWAASRGINGLVVDCGRNLGNGGVTKRVVEKLAKEVASTKRLIVIYGDSLININFHDLLDAHRRFEKHGGQVTVAVQDLEVLKQAEPTDGSRCKYAMLALDANGRATRFREKPPLTEITTSAASAAVFVINLEITSQFPKKEPFDLSTDFLTHLANGNDSCVFGFNIAPGYRFDIGSLDLYKRRTFDVIEGRLDLVGIPPDLHKLSSGTLAGKESTIAEDVVLIGTNLIGDSVTIGSGSIIHNSIIMDDATIGKQVQLRDCIIGRSVRIGDSVQLGRGTALGDWSLVETESEHL